MIEMIVVVTIVGILTTIGVASYNSFHQKRLVEEEAEELKSNLRLAQSKAVSNEKNETVCGTDILEGWYVQYLTNSSYKIYYRCGSNDYDYRTVSLATGNFDSDFGTIGFKTLKGVDLSADQDIIISNGTTVTVTVTTGGDIK